MILRRIAGGIKNQDWFVVLIEVFIVVVGIYIGLQVDDWNQARQDRVLEHEYLTRLVDEFQTNIDQYERGSELADVRIRQINLVIAVVKTPTQALQDPGQFVRSVEKASWTSFQIISSNVYDELTSTGRVPLILSVPLRAHLADYYRRIANWDSIQEESDFERQGYVEAIAGILTPDQLLEVQQSALKVELDPADSRIDGSQAIAVANELAGRPDAVKWLPGLYSYHILVQTINDELRIEAHAIIDEIYALPSMENEDTQ